MASERNRRLATKVLTTLRRSEGRPARRAASRPALEELLLGVLADGVSDRAASKALSRVETYFADWNEVRVSSVCEIASAMPNLADAAEKAKVLRAVLRRVYDHANEMTLDFLKEKSPRDAVRLVDDIPGFPESALARAAIYSLGHETFPCTRRVVETCRRLGIITADDQSSLLAEVKGLVPKNNMYEFHWLVHRHGQKVCKPEEPLCGECSFKSDCRKGREKSASAKRKRVSRK